MRKLITGLGIAVALTLAGGGVASAGATHPGPSIHRSTAHRSGTYCGCTSHHPQRHHHGDDGQRHDREFPKPRPPQHHRPPHHKPPVCKPPVRPPHHHPGPGHHKPTPPPVHHKPVPPVQHNPTPLPHSTPVTLTHSSATPAGQLPRTGGVAGDLAAAGVVLLGLGFGSRRLGRVR